MENKTLMTDFYELTMAQTYFMEGKADEEVYFDVFFRKNPFEGGYTVAAGLDETIKYIKNFHFGDEEIEYLRETGKFREEFSDALKNDNIEIIVVMVDDLDRCRPERIIEILEVIKLFLAVDRTTFIIAADENVIK